jgi:hypothetical protein
VINTVEGDSSINALADQIAVKILDNGTALGQRARAQ